MHELNISIDIDVAKEAGRHFIDAWHRAEKGEAFCERQWGFESWNGLARILTAERIELLRHVRRHDISSIEQLANELSRDIGPVQADVLALTDAKILAIDDTRMRVDFDAISIRVEL